MKAIIFSISVTFLSLTANAQNSIMNPICSQNPLSYTKTKIVGVVENNCPGKFPAAAMKTLFANELDAVKKMEQSRPETASVEVFKSTYAPEADVNYVMFQTLTHSFYMYPKKNGQFEIEQDIPGSQGCNYKYKVEERSGKRYCIPPMGLVANPKCSNVISKDPIAFEMKNGKKVDRPCDAFIEAMLSCSKNPSACHKISYSDNEDSKKSNSRPKGDEFNKPAPSTDR